MTMITEKETLGRAIGRIASGLFVVTAGAGEQKQGMLCSWVMQAGFEPPMVTVAVQKDRDMLKLIEQKKKFVINVLSDGNSNLMGPFAKSKPGQFEGIECFENDYGTVLQETVAFMSIELKEKWTSSDHFILLGQVVEGEIMNADLQPWTHLRKNGFVY